ncbi:hypothetical protein [Paenibacillus sp. 32O-W]|uniref:hypothetical protein n=1 Tax=Paenibacillus sp. 32O-W TaxID=1695218 RepID=UPI0011A73C05|nr:hypothetical protein [Paenibacillus sp. 32O-W]
MLDPLPSKPGFDQKPFKKNHPASSLSRMVEAAPSKQEDVFPKQPNIEVVGYFSRGTSHLHCLEINSLGTFDSTFSEEAEYQFGSNHYRVDHVHRMIKEGVHFTAVSLDQIQPFRGTSLSLKEGFSYWADYSILLKLYNGESCLHGDKQDERTRVFDDRPAYDLGVRDTGFGVMKLPETNPKFPVNAFLRGEDLVLHLFSVAGFYHRKGKVTDIRFPARPETGYFCVLAVGRPSCPRLRSLPLRPHNRPWLRASGAGWVSSLPGSRRADRVKELGGDVATRLPVVRPVLRPVSPLESAVGACIRGEAGGWPVGGGSGADGAKFVAYFHEMGG